MTTQVTATAEALLSPLKGWGLPAQLGARYHWSARAIYGHDHASNGGFWIDLVWDRLGFEGEATDAEKKELGAWLDKKALPLLRDMADKYELHGREETGETVISGDGYTLRANPCSSHGYLYLSAAPDPTATGKTPRWPS